ncbi:MAG: hypothetical protein AAFY02_02605 [Pseudomonadota bacterium]
MNDRFTEEGWLNGRLDATNDLLKEDAFSRVQSHSQRSASLLLGDAGNTPGGNQPTQALVSSGRNALTPSQEFARAKAYRDQIRHAIFTTLLDDAHDIDANTLYRMNFSVSIVPSVHAKSLAVAKVSIDESMMDSPTAGVAQGEPAEGSLLQQHYYSLFGEYKDMVQATAETLVRDRRLVLDSAEGFNPQESAKLDRLLEAKVRILLAQLEGTSVPDKVSSVFLKEAVDLFRFSGRHALEEQNRYGAREMLSAVPQGLMTEKERQKAEDRALALCRSDGSTVTLGALIGVKKQRTLRDVKLLEEDQQFQCWPSVPDTISAAKVQMLSTVILLVEALRDLENATEHKGEWRRWWDAREVALWETIANKLGFGSYSTLFSCTKEAFGADELATLLSYVSFSPRYEPSVWALFLKQAEVQLPAVGCERSQLAVRQLKRAIHRTGGFVTMDVGLSHFVMTSLKETESRAHNEEFTLDTFLSFDTGKCALDECRIVVSVERNKTSQNDEEAIQEPRVENRVLERFRERLNCGARAQTYALVPKETSSVSFLDDSSLFSVGAGSRGCGADCCERCVRPADRRRFTAGSCHWARRLGDAPTIQRSCQCVF